MTSVAALDDERLGRLALAGDRDAFAELFGRHERGLFNVSYRLTGNRDDAAEITQEAFLRVFARLDDLRGREVNLAAYLHRTARNLVYDRSARRAREVPTEEMERAAGADEAMEADPGLSSLVSAQGREVQAANARLPERHRLVLALRELEDMSYEDIGRVLDVTPGAVAQLLSRARAALRRELRLQQVDLERMDPACRARMGDIGALIDGELNPDRAQVLTAHLEGCEACRAARAAFEEARVTYRAWLPLPILGLGAEAARAAEARGLVRFSDAGARPGGAGGGRGGGPGAGAGAGGLGGLLGGRRRAAAIVGGALLALLLLVGVPTLVATRSGSSGPPAPQAAPAVAPAATSAAGGAATTAPATTAASTAGSTAPEPTPAAPAPASPAAALAPASPADATSTAARARTGAPERSRPRTPVPSVATVAPAAPTAPAPAPPPPPPTTTEEPPATTPPTTTPTQPTTPTRPRPPIVIGPLPTVIAPPQPPPPVIE